MKRLRPHPDGIVVAVSLIAAILFAWGLTAIVIDRFPVTPLHNVFYFTHVLAWGLGLSTLAILFALVVRKGHFPTGTSLYSSLCATSLALLSVQIFIAYQPFDPEIIYGVVCALLFAWVIITNRVLNAIFGRSDESSLLAGVGAIATIIIFNNYSRVAFIGVEHAILEVWRNIAILTLFHPLLFALQQYLKMIQDADQDRATLSFSQLSKSGRVFYAVHWIAAAAQAFAMVILASYYPQSTWLGSKILWASLSFTMIPAFYWSSQLWRHRPTHKVEKKQNASWIGMKTAVLLIDHDPHEECRLHLPALLYRARQLQCEQIVQRTFSKSILSQSAAGSQLSLALDPRATASPCVEALTIMSVIYIDGLSLVERRLKNLVNLLPLLDPEMATSLNTMELESIFSRLQGFFHLDYSWIDQSRDENKSQLDIRLEHLNARQRQRVLMQLSNSQWLGNFIWISDAAREQIRLESPYLMNAIERLPIKIEHQSGKIIEAAIFLIKYENLIPRLQHYYNFDEIRSRLSPLPMATETINFVQSIEEDMNAAMGFNAYQKLLHEIRNYEWQGFQAKDQALDLVMRTMAFATQQELAGKIREQDALELKMLARRAIHEIGYPSQDFHIEHLHKIELRQIQELQRICLDRSQARFEEAWLILASLPTKGMENGLALKILSIIKSATLNIDLKTDSFIVGKAIETFFALARAMPESNESELVQTLNLLADILVADRWEPEMLISFLDKKVSLDLFKGHNFHLYDDVLNRWERTIQSYKDEHPNGISLTLVLRWASFRDVSRAAS